MPASLPRLPRPLSHLELDGRHSRRRHRAQIKGLYLPILATDWPKPSVRVASMAESVVVDDELLW